MFLTFSIWILFEQGNMCSYRMAFKYQGQCIFFIQLTAYILHSVWVKNATHSSLSHHHVRAILEIIASVIVDFYRTSGVVSSAANDKQVVTMYTLAEACRIKLRKIYIGLSSQEPHICHISSCDMWMNNGRWYEKWYQTVRCLILMSQILKNVPNAVIFVVIILTLSDKFAPYTKLYGIRHAEPLTIYEIVNWNICGQALWNVYSCE